MYHKWQSFDVCFLRYGVRQKFYPPNNSENQMLGDMIILHMCNIMGNHMMYGSWDIEHNRHKFFWFWIIFCPFYLPTTWKMKKKHLEIYHFTQVYHDNHTMYGSWGMKHNRQNFLSFWIIFNVLLPLLTTQKIKILKKWK